MEEVKSRKVFRNSSDVRVYYLRTRVEGEPHFSLKPGMTVEALDEKEEMLLASLSDLRDVAKETPSLANSIQSLQDQLAAEKAKNAELKAEHEALIEQNQKMTRRADARPSSRR